MPDSVSIFFSISLFNSRDIFHRIRVLKTVASKGVETPPDTCCSECRDPAHRCLDHKSAHSYYSIVNKPWVTIHKQVSVQSLISFTPKSSFAVVDGDEVSPTTTPTHAGIRNHGYNCIFPQVPNKEMETKLR